MNLILLFPSDFISSNHVLLTGRRFEHVRSVVRAKPGDSLKVGLVLGKVGSGLVIRITDAELEMEVTLDADPPPPLSLTLLIALPRPKSLKRVIEAVAAMGVKKVYIMQSWRVEKSFWETPALQEEVINEHLILGLEQARDTMMPVVEIRKRFKPFVEDELPGIIAGTAALVAHPYTEEVCPRGVIGPVSLAIGPEGGFIPYEIDVLERTGFRSVNVGERILRVEQAVPAILGRLF